MATTTTAPPEVADRVIELLEAVVAEQRRTNALLEKSLAKDVSNGDARHAALVHAIARILDATDLPFTTDEVITTAASSDELADALDALHVATPLQLGHVFRSINGRVIGDYVIARDGRQWRLRRRAS